jgi:hypothetical protein
VGDAYCVPALFAALSVMLTALAPSSLVRACLTVRLPTCLQGTSAPVAAFGWIARK